MALSDLKCTFLQAVTKMVQEACTYVDQIKDFDEKLKLIDTLRTVTAGKVGANFHSHSMMLSICMFQLKLIWSRK